jgi:hypothetical protein
VSICVAGIGIDVTNETLHEEQGATATLSFDIQQMCKPKSFQLETVTVESISRNPKPTDVRKTFCQFMYDKGNACSSRTSGCNCSSRETPFKVSRAVTDPRREQWFIKAQTKSKEHVAEETVLINVTEGKYEYPWHAVKYYSEKSQVLMFNR